MPIEAGGRLGHYNVLGELGAGGMGVVYRARDTRLDRDVALKVLPQAFTEDPDRLARFEREAKVLASLNHPGIAAIHGLEESEGIKALVLELVEGPTLADRITQGPIPLDEALPIAKQIAEALEAAHEAGVIHRDLKPANIKVRDDGTVKVLDFGLAKALDPTPEGDPSQSPTLTAAATQMGVIMGTAAYMSPEQAAGKPTDKRSDIWSFGVVLFEMLTGQRVYTGETVSHVLGAVLQVEPPWEKLPAETPQPVRRTLERCLRKERKQRLHDIADARVELDEVEGRQDPIAPGGVSAPDRTERRRVLVPLIASSLAAAVLGSLTTMVFVNFEEGGPSAPTVFAVGGPEGLASGVPRLSSDGRTVAFSVLRQGVWQVYARPLDELQASQIRGSEGVYSVGGLSPSGQYLLVSDALAPRTLKRLPVAGGSPLPITRDLNGGVDWGPDETVLLGSDQGLWTISATGGERQQLTSVSDGETAHRQPHFLPSGPAVLFTVTYDDSDRADVAVYDLASQRGRPPGFAGAALKV